MNISLSPELEDFVQTNLRAGRYASASDLVAEALHLLEDQQKAREAELQEFRAELDFRLAAMDRGEVVDGEAAFERIREKSRARKSARA